VNTTAVYNKAQAITPSDTSNLDGTVGNPANAKTCQAIYVGGGGVVQVVFMNGSVCGFTCGHGDVLPVAAARVNDTGTTASYLMALYQV